MLTDIGRLRFVSARGMALLAASVLTQVGCGAAPHTSVASTEQMRVQTGEVRHHDAVAHAEAGSTLSIVVSLSPLPAAHPLKALNDYVRGQALAALSECRLPAQTLGDWARVYIAPEGKPSVDKGVIVLALKDGAKAAGSSRCVVDQRARRVLIPDPGSSPALIDRTRTAEAPVFRKGELAQAQVGRPLLELIAAQTAANRKAELGDVGLDSGALHDIPGLQTLEKQLQTNLRQLRDVQRLTLTLEAHEREYGIIAVATPRAGSKLSQLVAAQDRRPTMDPRYVPTEGAFNFFSYVVPTSLSEEVADVIDAFTSRNTDALDSEHIVNQSTLLTRLPFSTSETQYLHEMLTKVVNTRTGLTTFSAGTEPDGQPRARLFVGTRDSRTFLDTWLNALSVRTAREVHAGFTRAHGVELATKASPDLLDKSLGLAFDGRENALIHRTVQRQNDKLELYQVEPQRFFRVAFGKPANVVTLSGAEGVAMVAGVQDQLDLEAARQDVRQLSKPERRWFKPERRPWFGAQLELMSALRIWTQMATPFSLLARIAPDHSVLSGIYQAADKAKSPDEDTTEVPAIGLSAVGWSEQDAIVVEARLSTSDEMARGFLSLALSRLDQQAESTN